MDASLEGRTAVVTGGGAGIGARTAELLSAAGAHVVVVDRDRAAAESVAGALPSGQAVQLDLGDDELLESAIRDVPALTRADVLVNNAGLTRVERMTDSDPAGWDL